MRILVTGGNGFVGRYAVAALKAHGYEVLSASRAIEADSAWFDLKDGESIANAVSAAKPDVIFHLAARSFVPEALKSPLPTYEDNTIGTARLIEAVREYKKTGTSPRIIFASTADVYGVRPGPLHEELPLSPSTPYGASKAAAEAILQASRHSFHVDFNVGRCFNLIGPGQNERFALPSFARQLAEIAKGAEPLMHVGNLEAQRDFLDVRDCVAALILLAERGKSGEAYNICSGRAYSVREVLEGLIRVAGVRVEIREDPKRTRTLDNPISVGDNSKLRAATGWTPKYTLEKSLRDLYAYALRRVSLETH
jgi:GDP-4-dehydro-6-deoxy-D-mannose reductase